MATNESTRDLFDHWETVWHERQYDLIYASNRNASATMTLATEQ